jgi:uncharacterized protein YjbI with pentapeptide repeats
MRGADMSGANMCVANMSGANMRGAKNLDSVIFNENTAFFALQCPEEGSFVGWKKAKDNTIVKLLITENSKRSSATTRKCRCSEAKVLNIYDRNGNELEKAISTHGADFIYTVGETLKVDNFDEDRWTECSAGIHFFITRREAELYT